MPLILPATINVAVARAFAWALAVIAALAAWLCVARATADADPLTLARGLTRRMARPVVLAVPVIDAVPNLALPPWANTVALTEIFPDTLAEILPWQTTVAKPFTTPVAKAVLLDAACTVAETLIFPARAVVCVPVAETLTLALIAAVANTRLTPKETDAPAHTIDALAANMTLPAAVTDDSTLTWPAPGIDA